MMRRPSPLLPRPLALAFLAAALLSACSGSDASSGPDAASPSDTAIASDTAADAASDTTAGPDAGSSDATPDAGAPSPRRWTYRAIGGMSMGAMALNIALHRPQDFDIVGALGGYVDFEYMMTMGLHLHLSGFCPLSTLAPRLAEINDPAAEPPLFCGPVQEVYELEVPQDFNRMHWDDNGGKIDRVFLLDVFRALTLVVGNITAAPSAGTPYLPAGVPFSWLSEDPSTRCADLPVLPKALSLNAEYNPEGSYPVIPLCDAVKADAPGDFDPEATKRTPVDVVLAVDLNGNGRRDYAEPLLLNARERFADVGPDGCASAREDGDGGCLPAVAAAATDPDPNGDDFHWWKNPGGAEGNRVRDPGEPFSDLGLDGVDGASVGMPADLGEGNGVFDATPAFERARRLSAGRLFAEVPAEALARIDFYFDAGIRDVMHAALATRRAVGALHARGVELRYYRDFAGRSDSLIPGVAKDQVTKTLLTMDLSAAAIGRNVYVEYGNPDATPEEIAAGDGGHVGTTNDAVNRLATFTFLALRRFPRPDLEPVEKAGPPKGSVRSFYSEGLKARRNYSVVLPPGYDRPENAERRYPAIFFLHGLGQDATGLTPFALVISPLMAKGEVPKAIFAFPDGSCCYVHTPTGRRECACRSGPSGTRLCVEPQCKGPHKSCAEREIPKSELEEECIRGSLFYDLLTNRWGQPRDDLRYEQSVRDLIEHVDATYRTRRPEKL